MANASLEKGKRFEKFVCEQIELYGLGKATRQAGSGNGLRKGDIFTSIERSIECKNDGSMPNWLLNRIEQAEKQAMSVEPWLLILRDPRSPERLFNGFVVMDLHEWLELERKSAEPKTAKTENRELQWALKTAIQALKKLLSLIEL